MTVKSKFKPGDVVYYKSPSRYSRSKTGDTIEVILKIIDIESDDYRHNRTDYFYMISIIKVVSGKRGHWSGHPHPALSFGVESLEIELHSRVLTSAEKVLYG